MSEPRVIVLLVSPLETVFNEDGSISEKANESYQMLTDKGMKILFIADKPLKETSQATNSLNPPAPFFDPEDGWSIPDNSELQLPEKLVSTSSPRLKEIVDAMRHAGDVVIPIGIGRLPENEFLNDVELAALLPGSEMPERDIGVYICAADGPEGWSEWAETMMRRIRIILNKSEMRQWNGA